MGSAVRLNIKRKEGWDKVTGKAKYTDDLPIAGYLTARLLTSPHAHAKIVNINTIHAWGVKGVKAIITGLDLTNLSGVVLQDRPLLAKDVVRYAGEPVAMVVAVDEAAALSAIRLITVEYEVLPHVLTPRAALNPDAPILHRDLGTYKRLVKDVYPQAGSNICGQYHIRKGDMAAGWAASEAVVEESVTLPHSDHLAMEIRTARAEIGADGMVTITTASQAPYAVKQQLGECFSIPSGNIQVHVPLVGGGFGGKAPVLLEHLAYIASSKLNGRPVRVVLTREQDMAAAPCRMGLEAVIKLGADRTGKLQAAELRYWLDCGAYADISPYMAKSLAADCTGPYRMDNLYCDCLCVYTNHTYATSFRGFSHTEYTFCMERAMDELAKRIGMDPLELRLRNAIVPGDQTPTQVVATSSNMGNLSACLLKLKKLADWQDEVCQIDEHTVRAKGVACLWKAANPPTNAISGAMVTFNSDGSVNLNTGVVEIGSGGKTQLAQILADKLQLDVKQVHVVMGVDTRLNPKHYKTVASMTGYMAGNAVLRVAEDILAQLRANGAQAFGCNPEDIIVENATVYARQSPEKRIPFKEIALGYKAQDGSSVGEPILGRGGFMLKGLAHLNPQTGKGQTGPAWTVAAQAVEVEYNRQDHTYRMISASTVMDVGMVINPAAMREMIRGGMAMGISLSSRESCTYGQDGRLQTPTLRNYKLMHIGQEPDYRVGFVETPESQSPYGVRSYAEHGVIGIPAALGNALSTAFGRQLITLPLTPETIWRTALEEHA